MKTIAIIPARGGSKRLPGKNLLKIGSATLLEHSIAFAKANSTYIDQILISTDDAAIADVAHKHQVTVVHRPAELSTDESSTLSVLQHVLHQKPYAGVEKVILLQPTNPLRPSDLLRNAINIWNSTSLDSLFTCSPMVHKFGSIENNRFTPHNYSYGQRSQDLEPLYYENGLLYISTSASVKNGDLIGKNHHAMTIEHEYGGIDIDNQADLDYARYIWQRDNSH